MGTSAQADAQGTDAQQPALVSESEISHGATGKREISARRAHLN